MQSGSVVLRVVLARSLTTLARLMLSVTVGWELYERTGSALTLGLVGLMQIIPVLVMFIPSGELVDRRDRRRLAMAATLLMAAVGVGLALVSSANAPVPAFFVLLLVLGVVASVLSPASSALIPTIVARVDLPRANAYGSTGQELATIIGPGIAGLLLVILPAAAVYAVVAGTALCASVVYATLPSPPPVAPSTNRAATRRDWRVGLRFIFRSKLLLPALTLDLFAVLFAGAIALLPVIAKDILHTGPLGLGILRSAPALGALVMAVTQAQMGPWRRPGVTLLLVVAAYGAATIGFGLSTSLPLSVVLLAIGGGLDNVSAVIRMTLEQMVTPDEIRGRVSAVHHVFIGMSNELGELESGVAAYLFGAAPTIVGGGILAIGVVGFVAVKWRAVAAMPPLNELSPEPFVSS